MLSYDPNNVYLDLALGYGSGLNINQRNVANVSRVAGPASTSTVSVGAAPICSRPALFVRHTAGPAHITAALAYGGQDVTTNRVVTAARYDQLRTQCQRGFGTHRGGYRHAMSWLDVTPYAALQATIFNLPGYSEFAVVSSKLFGPNR